MNHDGLQSLKDSGKISDYYFDDEYGLEIYLVDGTCIDIDLAHHYGNSATYLEVNIK